MDSPSVYEPMPKAAAEQVSYKSIGLLKDVPLESSICLSKA